MERQSVTQALSCFVEVSIAFVALRRGTALPEMLESPETLCLGGAHLAFRTVRRVPQDRGSPVSPSQYSTIVGMEKPHTSHLTSSPKTPSHGFTWHHMAPHGSALRSEPALDSQDLTIRTPAPI
jgi:hypothetical protein